jgi:hypothetical protein
MTRRMEYPGVEPLDLPIWQVFLFGIEFVILWVTRFLVSLGS